MRFSIIVSFVAREETLDALNYYENIREGLGEDFLEDLEERYSAISENPFEFSYTDSKCILRDTSLYRFPFVIIFKVESQSVISPFIIRTKSLFLHSSLYSIATGIIHPSLLYFTNLATHL